MKNLTVKSRVLAVGAAWALITLFCGGFVYASLQRQLAIQATLEQSKQNSERFANLLTIMVDMETGIRGYLLSGEDTYLEPFNSSEGKFEQEARALKELISSDAEQMPRLDAIIAAKKAWIEGPAVEEMMARRKLTRNMIDYNTFINGFKASKGKELSDKIRVTVAEAIGAEGIRSKALLEEQTKSASRAKYSITLGIIFAVMLGMSMLVVTINRLNSTIRVLIASLARMANELSATSQTVETTSSTVLSVNEEIGSSLQSTGASVTEIASMAESNAKVAKLTQEATSECTTSAESVSTAVGKAINSMSEINRCTNDMIAKIGESNKKLLTIVELIQQVCSKTKVINDIVFQTKLLSFNASVEAARAGEHGKGFAVVAEEVGNLAQMSGNAAKEISDLLVHNEEEIKRTVAETTTSLEEIMKTIREKVQDGSARTTECEGLVGEIKTNVDKITHLISEIAQASNEQDKGVKNILSSIGAVDGNIVKATRVAKDSAETAEALSRSSSNLNDQVEQLRTLFEGSKRGATLAPVTELSVPAGQEQEAA